MKVDSSNSFHIVERKAPRKKELILLESAFIKRHGPFELVSCRNALKSEHSELEEIACKVPEIF